MVFGMFKNINRQFFKGYATRRYPFKDVREDNDNYRGEVKFIEQNCTFCMACQRVCPTHCIAVDRNEGIFELNPWQCIICGECVTACRFDALEMGRHWKLPQAKMESIYFKGEPPKKKKAEEE
jgi:ech hydrogenase subunit F